MYPSHIGDIAQLVRARDS